MLKLVERASEYQAQARASYARSFEGGIQEEAPSLGVPVLVLRGQFGHEHHRLGTEALVDMLPAATMDYFVDDAGSVFEADINAIAAAGITLGCNPPTNDRYCPTDNVTRAQMAAFLRRALDDHS